MTSDHDDDVRGLLECAAALAPDRLDRPPAAEQARRRTARRVLGGGLAVVLLAGAAALAAPVLDGGEQRLAQEGDTSVSTERFGVAYVDRGSYTEQEARDALDDCLALPGAENPSGLLPDPPIYTITATGTAEQRQAVEDCLRALPNTEVTDGDQQRAAGQTEKDVYTVLYDIRTYDEDRASRELDACTSLPGADMPTVAYSIPPQPAVTATGTTDQRQAVEQCLRALPNARIKQGPEVPFDIPVAVSFDAIGLEPLTVAATTPRLSSGQLAWLVHDLTLTNPTDEPVYVNDFRFAQMLTGVPAQDRRSAEAPGRLFVGLGCGYGQSEPGAPVAAACDGDYRPTVLQPGESATFEVKIWRDLAGMDPPQARSGGYPVAFPVHTRTTAPYVAGEDNNAGPEATVRLTYRPGVAGLLGPESEQVRANRASFQPLTAPGSDAERRFNTARAEGVLGGDSSTGCLWLSAPGTARSTPIVLMHDSAVADFNRTPWVIRDGDRVLATEGDPVVLGGGYGPNGQQGAVPGCPVTGAPFIGQLHEPRD